MPFNYVSKSPSTMRHFYFLDSFGCYKVLLALNENRSKAPKVYLYTLLSVRTMDISNPKVPFTTERGSIYGKTAPIKGMEGPVLGFEKLLPQTICIKVSENLL